MTARRRLTFIRAPRRVIACTAALSALLLIGLLAPSAQASFGINSFDATFVNQDGSPDTQAGSHPFAVNTTFAFNRVPVGHFPFEIPDQEPKDVTIEQVAGLVGDSTAMPKCSTADFSNLVTHEGQLFPTPDCPRKTAVGGAALGLISPGLILDFPVYNLVPPPGVVAKLGFYALDRPDHRRSRPQEWRRIQRHRLAHQSSPGHPDLQLPGPALGQPHRPRPRPLPGGMLPGRQFLLQPNSARSATAPSSPNPAPSPSSPCPAAAPALPPPPMKRTPGRTRAPSSTARSSPTTTPNRPTRRASPAAANSASHRKSAPR